MKTGNEKKQLTNLKKVCIEILILVVFFLALRDLYTNFPMFSLKWRLGFLGISFTYVLIYTFLTIYLHSNKITQILSYIKIFLPYGIRLMILSIPIILFFFFLLYTKFGSYFKGEFFRLSVLLIISLLLVLFLSDKKNKHFDVTLFLFSSSLVGFLFTLLNYGTEITSYPFSRSWSEGNRFYDYSLIFGKYIYNFTGDLTPNYESPGRYGLWGVWFLIPNLPIWFHRLWNAFLWTITPLLLGFLITRKVSTKQLKGLLTLWFALYLLQGPVYPSLIVSLILLSLGIWSKNIWIRGLSVIGASIFAGMSRYFWILVPGTWIVLHDLLFFFPNRKGTFIKRFLPTVIWGLLGILPGTYFGFRQLFSTKTPFEMNQPLLFYRLLPNSTYPLGIIINFLMYFSPIIICLIWIILENKKKLDSLTRHLISLSLFTFVGMGFIASSKIGGGSNLHNLDMFIVTSSYLFILIVTLFQSNIDEFLKNSSIYIRVILLLVFMYPSWISIRTGTQVVNPTEKVVSIALNTINHQIEKAKDHGDILFIDQRQLLTFGYIRNIKLIPEYEKKYMMDQAMGNNQQYFDGFYEDLKNSRFSIIVSDPLTTNIQGREKGFSEENNSYVNYVSKPILDYYYPLITLDNVEVQILVPRSNCRIVPGMIPLLDCNY